MTQFTLICGEMKIYSESPVIVTIMRPNVVSSPGNFTLNFFPTCLRIDDLGVLFDLDLKRFTVFDRVTLINFRLFVESFLSNNVVVVVQQVTVMKDLSGFPLSNLVIKVDSFRHGHIPKRALGDVT